MNLVVIIPAFNEEATIADVVRRVPRVVERIERTQVIVVDDGSSDGTVRAARDAGARVVSHGMNRGVGAAFVTGVEAALSAGADVIVNMDGDGQFDFEEIDNLLPLLDRFDIVSAYRVNRQDSIIRKLNAFAWTTLVSLVFWMRVRDIDCAFKLFPRRLFDEIEMKSTGALIDAEILARAKRLGYRIGQVGVNHYPRTAGDSTAESV
ncbi:MAG: glycosyltransferase family 2 protein [Proteobacteria bacterium]|nr:glycosyltransferase family 2 protein [Pseudomonadota bacterium]